MSKSIVIGPAAGAGAIERKQVRRSLSDVPVITVCTCCQDMPFPEIVGTAGSTFTKARVLATKISTSALAPGWTGCGLEVGGVGEDRVAGGQLGACQAMGLALPTPVDDVAFTLFDDLDRVSPPGPATSAAQIPSGIARIAFQAASREQRGDVGV